MVQQVILDKPGKRRLSTGKSIGFLLVERGSVYWASAGKAGINDLLLCSPGQVLELEYARVPTKALWVRLTRQQIQCCSTEQTDLLSAFSFNPQPVISAHPGSETLMLLKSLAMQMMRLDQRQQEYASDLVELATRQMFLAMAVQAFYSEDPHCGKPLKPQESQFSLDEVFRYIHTHLTEELTLDILEKEFYVSREHLIRQFKKQTGQTVHSYIVRCRLDLCRSFIEQGCSITEASRMGGFGGYNHFFKVFRKAYGMTPKEYYRQYQQQSDSRICDAPG